MYAVQVITLLTNILNICFSAWANANSTGEKTYDPVQSAGNLIYEERAKPNGAKRRNLFLLEEPTQVNISFNFFNYVKIIAFIIFF